MKFDEVEQRKTKTGGHKIFINFPAFTAFVAFHNMNMCICLSFHLNINDTSANERSLNSTKIKSCKQEGG